VVLHGSLFDAIRASIPSRRSSDLPLSGSFLVDGGLLNPLPVSPTLRDPPTHGRGRHQRRPSRCTVGAQWTGESADRGRGPGIAGNVANGKPAPVDMQRAGYRKRIAESSKGDRARSQHDRGTRRVQLFARALDAVQRRSRA
jgi:NTE family protein